MAQGRPAKEVAAVTGYCPDWIHTILQRYDADGPEGLGDRRYHNPGAPALLADSLEAAHPEATVERWAEDERRLGLKRILRRGCAKRGHRPIVPVHSRCHWAYLAGFVRPITGQPYWLLVPTVTAAALEVQVARCQ